MTITHFGSRLALLLASALLPSFAMAQAKPDDGKIDLKLFDKAEVDRSKGCSVALWQANRDPDKDRYAFIFAEALTGQNNARQPARIKIGDQVLSLTRVAVGGKAGGYGLHPYQLYRLAQGDGYAVLELKLGEIEGEAVEIESGSLVLSLPGKQQFKASVKGGAGCMTAAAPPPPAPPQQAAASTSTRASSRSATCTLATFARRTTRRRRRTGSRSASRARASSRSSYRQRRSTSMAARSSSAKSATAPGATGASSTSPATVSRTSRCPRC